MKLMKNVVRRSDMLCNEVTLKSCRAVLTLLQLRAIFTCSKSTSKRWWEALSEAVSSLLTLLSLTDASFMFSLLLLLLLFCFLLLLLLLLLLLNCLLMRMLTYSSQAFILLTNEPKLLNNCGIIVK